MPLRIFVTTDNHIGCHENSIVRCEDASNTFEEIMALAAAEDVDFVLQCGDLFDKNRPSKLALYKTVKTLREQCFSDRPVEFEVCNDVEFMLEDAEPLNHPNFEDMNINVGLPVFAISGNHDDSGGGYGMPISPLDILGAAGLINHFGRVHDNTNIDVYPILIKKEGVRVALYGFGNVRDERLYQTFKEGRVRFHRPAEEPDSWYSILVLHQNHAHRGTKKLNPEDLLPKFLDLVIWGHEHECLIEPQWNPQREFYVMQPGSSVVTSYHSSEAGQKCVAVVSIGENKEMISKKHALQTVRPFLFRSVVLAEEASHIDPHSRDARRHVMEWLTGVVEVLINEAQACWRATHDAEHQEPMLPLIRLKVDYSHGYELENAIRFGNTFVDRVANPEDILYAVRRRETELKGLSKVAPENFVDENTSDISIAHVAEIMRESLRTEHLQVLKEKEMGEAIRRFVEKDETNALNSGVESLVEQRLDELRLGEVELAASEIESIRNGNSEASKGAKEPAREEGRATSTTKPRSTKRAAPKRKGKPEAREPEPVQEAESIQVSDPSKPRRTRSTRAPPLEPDDDDDDDANLEDDEDIAMFSSEDD